MAAFASALEGVLLHAVAALEAEDAGTSADAQTAYNSAWCALTCAVELHGGPDGTGLHELVRETCRALLDTYRLRYEALGGAGEEECAGGAPFYALDGDAGIRRNGSAQRLAVAGHIAPGHDNVASEPATRPGRAGRGPDCDGTRTATYSDGLGLGRAPQSQQGTVDYACGQRQAPVCHEQPPHGSVLSAEDDDPHRQRLCQRRRLDAPPTHITACAGTPDSSGWEQQRQQPQRHGGNPHAGTSRGSERDHPGTPSTCRQPSSSSLSSAAPTHQPPLAASAAASAGRGGRQAPPPEAACAPAPAGEAEDEATVEVLKQCLRHVAPGGSLDELAGLGDIKQELRMALLLPLRMPHLFTGIRHPPRNFLLHGPPGTGKTMLVERIASETGAALLVLTPGAILSKWAGESEKQLRGVFTAAARMGRPCIVFMDEVDSLGSARGSGDDPMSRRLLNELLVHMSMLAGQQQQGRQQQARLAGQGAAAGQVHAATPAGSGATNPVYIFAATNRMQDCDPALLRRFDRRIAVPLPDAAARQAFLRGVLAQPELAGHVLTQEDIGKLAELTAGYSGSDLSQLCREAAMRPLRELLERQLGDLAAQQPWASSASTAAVVASGEDPHGCVRALAMEDFAQAMVVVRTAAADGGRGETQNDKT